MIVDVWTQVLIKSFEQLWLGFVSFVPQLVVGLVILLVGWLVGSGAGRVAEQVLNAARLDQALRAAGATRFLEHIGWEPSFAVQIGKLVKWFVFLVFLVAAFDVLNLEQVNDFLREVVLTYLPRVVVAVLILLAGAVVGDTIARVAEGSARAAEMPSAGFVGSFARWSIWVIAILTALDQLGIATVFVQTFFTGVVVAVSLALGLAFGLGGQDAARRAIERLEKRFKSEEKKS
ncbi:mechanosensitive ion channel family protein [Candidatus Parcubacteria bacterium]|nr:MAG: mechanosensitive ion channel family protein [Candidatus Parcubacteria bacterium]